MEPFDELLVGAPLPRVLDALTEAAARANQDHALLELDRSFWEELAPRLREEREGRRQWSDTARGLTAYVNVSWWSDRLGRRHFRVRGGRLSGGAHPRLIATRHDRRPPVWHIYPERIYQRTKPDGSADWLAACHCGACAAPTGLAWSGVSCGPCHDALLDEPTGSGARPPPPTTLRGHRGRVSVLAFSPDGESLLSDGEDGRTLLWDLAGGQPRQEMGARYSFATAFAFSPDGLLLASGDAARELVITDLETDEVVAHHGPFDVSCLAFAPHGLSLAVGGPGGLQVWDRPGRSAGWRLAHSLAAPATALAFSPTGDRLLAAGEGAPVLLGTSDWRVLELSGPPPPPRHTVLCATFTEDGRRFLTVSAQPRRPRLLEHLSGQGARLVSYEQGASGAQARQWRSLEPLERPCFLPGARWLAYLPVRVGEDTVHVAVRDVTREDGLTLLGWDLEEPLLTLAASPDGATLATGGARGTIKLWPWSQLLNA